jgi:hypothetical protein
MLDLEWFRTLAAVPGVQWSPPDQVAVEPAWAEARPVVEELGGDERNYTFVEWVDEGGKRLPDEMGYGSPAQAVASRVYESENTAEVLRMISTALSLPGTRRDYFDAIDRATAALSRLDDENPTRGTWIEYFCRLAISLLRAGVEKTLIPFGTEPHERGRYLSAAARPYQTLVALYQREGFLREAAAVFAELEQLPSEARERSYPQAEPKQLLAALDELAREQGLQQ